MKLSSKEFEQVVKDAIDRIPEEIQAHLTNVTITVLKRPSRDMLVEWGMEAEEELLGLYEGASLLERSILEPSLYPDTIFIFQEPLERMCETREELEREIEVTVVHEVGHFLGMGEERLAELGYD
ncbi:MAG: metallopeptidase family protein [Syntrophales bacterium]|jgi:predicted Zn-dependent protease with MMP-like domain|nr:metallopeptidase family protein [Syntrophales bacterium]